MRQSAGKAGTNTEVTSQQPPPRRRAVRGAASTPRASIAGRGAVVGIVAALVALGVAELVAAVLSSPLAQPVQAVGELSINHVPSGVKNFAIRAFGSNDKTVLVWGIYGVLTIFAVVIGALALRRLWLGLAGLVLFAAVGVYATLSQPDTTAKDALPTLVGAAVAALAMRYFARRAGGPLLARSPFAASGRGATARATRPGTATSRPGAAPPDADQRPEAPPRPSDVPLPGDAGQPPDDAQHPAAPPARKEIPGAASDPARVPAWAGGGPAWSPPGYRQVGGDVTPLPDRRKFLQAASGTAAASLVTFGVSSWVAENRNVNSIVKGLKLPAPATPLAPLPSGTNFKIPGLSSFVTPNSSFYRVDTAIILPEIAPSTWQLRIHGMVTKEIVLNFDDLLKQPLIEDYVTLCCVSNWVGGPYVGNAKWLGVSLRSLLRQAGIKAGADQLFCRSSDGFTSGTPVQTAMDGRDAMLAVAMNDMALPVAHGFPARLVIPGLYGYVSACKWITDIEVTTYQANVSYWAQRGWDAQAPIKTESRIDVPNGQNPVKAGKTIQVAGVAWAQHKGIDAVEVRVAKGPWQQARLAAVPGIDCWRQWVYDWDVTTPGNYLIEARATDKTGYTQTSLAEPPEPNGASGYPSVLVNVTS
jgi:DMSO/TMAO reductase YedYZ molybdopterin-dependent catalytic subunit